MLIPVIRLLQAQPNWEVAVLGYSHALARFAKKGIGCNEIAPVQKDDFLLLDSHAPDLLITSATSMPCEDMSEKYLWQHAKQRGIPSLAFLDQWQNYSERFSDSPGLGHLAYLPDWINCLNEIGRKEMALEGFDENRLVAFGHPYLSSLKHDLPLINEARLKTMLHVSAGDKVVLFVSEAIREYCGDTRGYDQYQVLDYLLSNFTKVKEPLKILVKLHPKDNLSSFQTLAKKFETLSPQFICNELSPLECLAVSDCIFGMTSIMLIEAYVLGKKAASLQPGLSVEDPMVLSRHNLIPVVLSSNECNLLELDHQPYSRFDVDFNAAKLLDFIGKVAH